MKLDITLGFGPCVPGSSPGGGTRQTIMKKLLLIFLVSLAFLAIFSPIAKAQQSCGSSESGICDESNGGTNGLVPCGRALCPDGVTPVCACQFDHVGILAKNIFNFVVWNVSTPLAGLGILVGGVMLIFSGANPNLANRAKEIIRWTIIAILIIFCSWIIINFILLALGVSPNFIPPPG